MQVRSSALALCLALLAACNAPDQLAAPDAPDAARGTSSTRETYIVAVTDDPASLAALHSARFVYRHALNGFSADLTPQAASALSRNPHVQYVSLVRHVRPIPSTDPYEASPVWNLDRIDQQKGTPKNLDGRYYYWSRAGAGVHAYIIDSGIRSTHQDFAGRVSGGVDFVGDGYGTEDCAGHGTHVAGTLGGTTYGVAKQVLLVPVRVFPCSGGATSDVIIAALDWTIANAVRPAVVNMSLGGPVDPATNQAVANATASGLTVAVAGGNYQGDVSCSFSPASAPSAITVGATSNYDDVYWGGGTCTDLFAPGVSIVSDWFISDDASATLSGTSMATPHVAGAAALYLAYAPSASPSQVTSYLLATATSGVLGSLPPNSPNLLLRTHATESAP